VSKKGETGASRLRVDLTALRIALILVAAGIVVLFVAEKINGDVSGAVAGTVREVGALFVASGVLSVFWELLGRRALTSELLDAAQLSADVTNAGLRRITSHYLDIEWDDLLDGATHVDLFFAYARTWRGAHATPLRGLAQRNGARLRVVVPDLNNTGLMSELAVKFQSCAEDVVRNIEDAESDIANLHRQSGGRCEVELRRTSEFPVYTYYRFDRSCFVVFYSQAPGRVEVPAFQCEQGGWLSTFFRGQFDTLWEGASVRALGDDLSA
jgi:hypothetical protein